MAEMKTPGVYIAEVNAFPPSVVEVPTAVPAFVGYTRQAEDRGKALRNLPVRIGSLDEYGMYFGTAPDARFSIDEHTDAGARAAFTVGGTGYDLTQLAGPAGGRYLLTLAMRHFFQNGGGSCYVVSVGGFEDDRSASALVAGIDALVGEQEPTMLVVPDAVRLSAAECAVVQQAMLAHCGVRMRNRVAILDVWGGAHDRQGPLGDPVAAFRDALGTEHLGYAAAYYPWVHTTVVQEGEVGCWNVVNRSKLAALVHAELGLPAVADDRTPPRLVLQMKVVADLAATEGRAVVPTTPAIGQLDNTLKSMSPLYQAVLAHARAQLNLLPPSAAMAGVYTAVDGARGVWKAPANVALAGVEAPAVALSDRAQDDLNVSADGKSVNAIRAFPGRGVVVWGGRTLDGNSAEWRYVSVRRTMIMLEQSCRLAVRAMVFERNDAGTWLTVRSMLANFLTGVWKEGGLAGAKPEEAFAVQVGLGESMTQQDVVDGLLRVTVLVAVVRPAEFMAFRFEQPMQAR